MGRGVVTYLDYECPQTSNLRERHGDAPIEAQTEFVGGNKAPNLETTQARE